jgi:hypothetical protein
MRLWCLVLLAPLASCGGDDCCKFPDAGTGDGGSDGRVEVARVPVTVNADIDMLFVIDDSPSTLDKQQNLKNAFPAFINELNGLPGGLPNVHIGVVTSDLGTKGSLDAQPGPGIGSGPGSCSGNGKAGNLQTNATTLVVGAFISDIRNTDGTRTTNYTGTLANAFSAIASVGAGGCGFEQPLEAAKRALNNNPTNAGFLRPNASLAIITLTDEDDCSLAHSTLLGSDTTTLGPLQSFRCTRFGVTCDVGGTTSDEMNTVGVKGQCHSNESSAYLTHVDDYPTFFKGLKADPNHVLFAALIGDVEPFNVELRAPPGGGTPVPTIAHSCMYQGSVGLEVADPAVRMAQAAKGFARNSLASVCQADVSQPLVDIARQVRGLVGDSCLTRAIAMPADCIVRDEVGTSSTTLPACDNGASSTNKPCYELLSDPAACTAGSHLRIQVQRSSAPPGNTVVVAACRV